MPSTPKKFVPATAVLQARVPDTEQEVEIVEAPEAEQFPLDRTVSPTHAESPRVTLSQAVESDTDV